MRLPFCIFKVRGEGSPRLIEAAQTLDAAKARVKALAELWSGEYVIIHKKEKRGETLLQICYKPSKSKGTKSRWVVRERKLKNTSQR